MPNQSHVFPRHCHSQLPTVARGDGCYLYDTEGKAYLDACGGAAVSCLGHNFTPVIDAVTQQMQAMAYAHTSFFTSEPAEELATLLAAHAPGDLNRSYFVCGGSEAMEAALKLARQYALEKGQESRKYIVARQQSYHGNTLGALATGGNQWRRKPFEPLMVSTSHIPPCYAYRYQHEGESDDDYALRSANHLRLEIERLGPENVLAFVAEPVVGATLGAVPPVGNYFQHIRQICDEYGVLLILDEVMCGMGRTGSLFACEQDGIEPDILIAAKGLGAGYQPIGVMMCQESIYQTIAQGSGFFQHGHTYIGHPAVCAAGLQVVRSIVEGNLPEQIVHKGQLLQAMLLEAFGDHPHIGNIRGRGLFVGLELVENKAIKDPFPRQQQINKRIKQQAFANGLMCYPMGGTIDGSNGDHVLLAPPYIISEAELQTVVDILETSFAQVFA